jgi:hypothetical protein
MWGVSMDNEQREIRLTELGQVSDRLKDLKLKRLELESEQEPIVLDYKEVRYKYLVAIENEDDPRGIFANEDRKQDELEHRLRLDPEARDLSLKLRQSYKDLEQADIEIENLKDKKMVLLTTLGLPFPQDIMDIISDEMEEGYDQDEGNEDWNQDEH